MSKSEIDIQEIASKILTLVAQINSPDYLEKQAKILINSGVEILKILEVVPPGDRQFLLDNMAAINLAEASRDIKSLLMRLNNTKDSLQEQALRYFEYKDEKTGKVKIPS